MHTFHRDFMDWILRVRISVYQSALTGKVFFPNR